MTTQQRSRLRLSPLQLLILGYVVVVGLSCFLNTCDGLNTMRQKLVQKEIDPDGTESELEKTRQNIEPQSADFDEDLDPLPEDPRVNLTLSLRVPATKAGAPGGSPTRPITALYEDAEPKNKPQPKAAPNNSTKPKDSKTNKKNSQKSKQSKKKKDPASFLKKITKKCLKNCKSRCKQPCLAKCKTAVTPVIATVAKTQNNVNATKNCIQSCSSPCLSTCKPRCDNATATIMSTAFTELESNIKPSVSSTSSVRGMLITLVPGDTQRTMNLGIQTDSDDVYQVEKTGQGPQMIDFAGLRVEATGTLAQTVDGQNAMNVKSFRVLQNQEY